MDKLELTDVFTTVPTKCLEATFGTKVVTPGLVFTPTEVMHAPTLKWEADPKKFYTLAMTDPDAPSRKDPKMREWLHWYVTNIPGTDVSKGEVCYAYVGAGPPEKTGLHRYVLTVYPQAGKVIFTKEKQTNAQAALRGNQKIEQLAKDLKLEHAEFVNCFQAEYDDYVPKLYKQLGF